MKYNKWLIEIGSDDDVKPSEIINSLLNINKKFKYKVFDEKLNLIFKGKCNLEK